MDPVSEFITNWKVPVGRAGQALFEFIEHYFGGFFDFVKENLEYIFDVTTGFLISVPPVLLILVITLVAWWLRRSKLLALGVFAGLLFILNQGPIFWTQTVQTLVLVVAATAMSMAIGVPIGIWASHNQKVWRVVQPLLDFMQTMPTFAYLIPVLMLFGIGATSALLVTIIFAMPAPVRMTYLGITSIPKPMIEAGESFGATKWQLLRKVELPAARPSIVAGLTQCIMLSLSMVVIASLIGAPGLGESVIRALNNRNMPVGIESGLALVILAIVLDRMLAQKAGRKK